MTTKQKENGNTANLPRKGRPTKLTDLAKRGIMRVVTKRPKLTLKQLQSFTAAIGVSVHNTILSCTLHKAGPSSKGQKKRVIA